MLRRLLLISWVLLAPIALSAQGMSDGDAFNKAHELYGSQGSIARFQTYADPSPTFQVGYKSVGCVDPFTKIGSALTSWDNAFTAAAANTLTVGGPFKGSLSVSSTMYSPTAILTATAYVDGTLVGTLTPATGTLNMTATFLIDTTTLADDFHVLCVQATNASGLGKTYTGWLFQTNQTTGTAGAMWDPGMGKIPQPQVAVIRTNPSLTATFLGATGEDLTSGTALGPDGVPDWHIQVQGLKTGMVPFAVSINAGPAAANGVWFTPFNGNNWVIATVWNGTTGDLWFSQFQPPASASFTITLTYIDGTQQIAIAPITKAVANKIQDGADQRRLLILGR